MWLLKNCKELLNKVNSHSFSKLSSIQTFDFSTCYTTILHKYLKVPFKKKLLTTHFTLKMVSNVTSL